MKKHVEVHITYEYANGNSEVFVKETEHEGIDSVKLHYLGSLRTSEWITFSDSEGNEVHIRTSSIVKATAEVYETDGLDDDIT